jgi:hypothetical protein
MVIDGRFELRERLGSGGMGTVWRALDLALRREVALKEVRLAESTGEDDSRTARMLRERVMREARALARLDHPNVVTIHHVVDGPEITHPWIVMELVRGRSLEDRLEEGPMGPAEAAAMGRGVLAALSCAHAAGISHRDVKPANVLLRGDGRPVLTDFGIAALSDWSRVTATGGLVGSPAYIAPERLHGQEGNPASDLWSLGMLLYVAVEGHNPMRRATTAATLAAVMKGEVLPPRRAGPLAPVLRALLTPNPASRPAGAQLDRMLSQASGGAPLPGVGLPADPPRDPGVPPAAPSPSGAMAPPHATAPPSAMAPGGRVPTGPHRMPDTSTVVPRPRPRRRWGGLVAALVALLVVGGLIAGAVIVIPKMWRAYLNSVSGLPNNPIANPGFPGGGGGVAGPSDNLLTPAGIRGVISALEKASGGQEFTKFTIFENGYGTAEAPVRGRPNLYDRFLYRNGQAIRQGPGGTISSFDRKVKLRSFNWDALPGLLQRGERTLKIPKPTNRYVNVQTRWPFNGNRPTILVYLTDDYGAGYLAADARGKVVSTSPR